jgi:hypothetical protein
MMYAMSTNRRVLTQLHFGLLMSCGWVSLFIVGVTPAAAHKPSDSYLRIRDIASGPTQTAQIQWDIALRDLEFVVGLDADQDGQITWGELRSKQGEVAAYALARLELASGSEPYRVHLVDLKVVNHSDGSYAALELACERQLELASLSVSYSLLFDVDPTHRGLVLLETDEHEVTYVLSGDRPTVAITGGEVGLAQTLLQYVREGVWHIWIGFDHILFLLALLLPAVYFWMESRWQPVDEFRPAFRSVLKIVTVFTVAHSLTLWLAVMEYVNLPSQWVEATIAVSIIVTALNNLYPVLRLPAWSLAFIFGLIHGFGFANVLTDLGLSSRSLAVSLFGFNVGVELGQLAIVAVCLPLAFLLRNTTFYRRVVFQCGSVAVAIVAAIWTYERVAGVELLGF